MIIKTFLTPHGSRCATAVAIARPSSLKIAVQAIFLTRRAPKGRAEDRKLDEYFRKVKGSKPEKREGDQTELEHEALREKVPGTFFLFITKN